MKSSLKDNFCSSPWFHIRINPAGYFLPCRWDFFAYDLNHTTDHNISNTTISEYMNSDVMQTLRSQLLDGQAVEICKSCRYEDQSDKVSGRQRQLLKSAITLEQFEKSLCASPHWTQFEYSHSHQGLTKNRPVDLQIDLGNVCNSGCLMCIPTYSSRLAVDFPKLHKIEPELFTEYPAFKNWADDDVLVEKFIQDLTEIPDIKYLHFLGGETLYLKSFYTICEKLIERDLAKNIILGTTTNCTIYDNKLEKILSQFKQVHLGLSIESINPVNDYIRWPSQIDDILENINKFLKLRDRTNLHLSLRITPNIFSIYHLDTVFEFMIKNSITAESCNILKDPSSLRMELLPTELVTIIIDKIKRIQEKYTLDSDQEKILNRRRDDLTDPVISNIISEYLHFLENMQAPNDVEDQRFKLVKFIKAFESIRNNKILDYLPEYEEFLRSHGY